MLNDPMGDLVDGTTIFDIINTITQGGHGGYWHNSGNDSESDFVKTYNSDNDEILDNIPGSAFSVSRDGHIAPDSKTRVFGKDDILTAENSDHITVTSGVLQNKSEKEITYQDIEGKLRKGTATYFDYNDNSKAEDLFLFLARHTDVEWSLTGWGKTGNIISTVHDENVEPVGSSIIKTSILAVNRTLRYYYHNHPAVWPKGFGPSGYEKLDPAYHVSGDWSVINSISQSPFAANAVYKVYEVTFNMYFTFDTNHVTGINYLNSR